MQSWELRGIRKKFHVTTVINLENLLFSYRGKYFLAHSVFLQSYGGFHRKIFFPDFVPVYPVCKLQVVAN